MITVEATLLIPILILTIFALIYLGIVHYQNTMAAAEATRAANRVASYWSYIDKDNPACFNDDSAAEALISKHDYTGRSPYRFLIETAAAVSGRGKRQANAKSFTESRITGVPFKMYTGDGGTVATMETRPGFLSTYVAVSVEKRYTNPLGNMLLIFGYGENYRYNTTVSALITSPTEFIRNIDIIFQLGSFLAGLL